MSDSMDIFDVKPGARVVFANPDAGYPSDILLADDRLELGRVYTVERTAVDGFETRVWLREVPNASFNSVSFDDAPEAG